MFRAVDQRGFPAQEVDIIQFWNDRQIFEKSLANRRDAHRFVFYEGPPTANGLPHPGHCLTRAVKDIFPRYRTMRGYLCERKAGWDTHGLPVEVEVCKELGIHSKEEIEAYGVEPFIFRCQESVFRYTLQWEKLTERLGFWVHLQDAYVTYHRSYVESVWWSLKQLFDRGLLYQGNKIVWWWAQGGTALSAGEVGQGYREVADPSVFVRFPLVDQSGADLLVWTTTPWTLPSNQFAAVHPKLEYAKVVFSGSNRPVWMAAGLVEKIAQKIKQEARVEETRLGVEMLGWRYHPPFDHYYARLGQQQGQLMSGGQEHVAWRIVAADFVTTDSGSGLVHQAPAFGEVDHEVLLAEQARFVDGEGPTLICAVAPDGKFTAEFPPSQGKFVKDADKEITRMLRDKGLLFHQEQYLHDYPFCWRADQDPLIQYPRKSWYIRTTQFREKMLANNATIGWLPEHIKDGRFGNFLESNVDWALSRERYWGTPLPIWVCEKTGKAEAIGSYAELTAKPNVRGQEVWEQALQKQPNISEHLQVHKPYIDAITYDSPFAAGSRMRRVPEVIDCWFDSGAMPFAQWGYPHLPHSKERLLEQFPADFISEALDQTRGWFYSLLAISTMLFGEDDAPPVCGSANTSSSANNRDSTSSGDKRPRAAFPHPFANCVVLGLMLGEDGQKMSKKLRNYREPDEIFDRYGADALRWYFFANQPPWTSIRYKEQAIKESIPDFLLRLWNVYSFFVIYANIDGFDPAKELSGDCGQLDHAVLANAKSYSPVGTRNELDRWLLAELEKTTQAVVEAMDAYDNYGAAGHLHAFVDALSNWYIRRGRGRFWSSGKFADSRDKQDVYWTLYEVLLTTSKLVGPFIPFMAENLWQNLAAGRFGSRAVESVHLCDYPVTNPARLNPALSEQMALVREIVSLGRAARMSGKLKVRLPLAKVEILLAQPEHQTFLVSHADLIKEELNVKQVEYPTQADKYVRYQVQPDLKKLGPKLGKMLPAVKQFLANANGAALLQEMQHQGQVTCKLQNAEIPLTADEIQIRLDALPGWAAAQGSHAVVVVSTEITQELQDEGLTREFIHAVQNRRKEQSCEYTDRIRLGVQSDDPRLRQVLTHYLAYVCEETLAVSLEFANLPGVEAVGVEIEGISAHLSLAVVPHERPHA